MTKIFHLWVWNYLFINKCQSLISCIMQKKLSVLTNASKTGVIYWNSVGVNHRNSFPYSADVKPIINKTSLNLSNKNKYKHMSMLSLCVYYDLYGVNSVLDKYWAPLKGTSNLAPNFGPIRERIMFCSIGPWRRIFFIRLSRIILKGWLNLSLISLFYSWCRVPIFDQTGYNQLVHHWY